MVKSMFAPLRNNARKSRSLVASGLVLVLFAMQWTAALHRSLHAPHAAHTPHLASHEDRAHAAHDHHDHSDQEHAQHRTAAFDPWAHHDDAADCERIDASLSPNPVAACAIQGVELRVRRAEKVNKTAAAVALRPDRARVRDPPLEA
jgi:hypothetical protein